VTLDIVLKLKKKGYAELTLEGIAKKLKFLIANTDVNNPETVKGFIAKQDQLGKAYKEGMVTAYNHYTEHLNLK
jgi:hypothetical protein